MLRRIPFMLLLLALASRVVAQEISVGKDKPADRVGLRDLQQETTHVAGQGDEVPGIDLRRAGGPRHWIGADSSGAERTTVDTTWARLQRSEDSVVTGATVHWIRYHLRPKDELRDVPLLLNVQARCAFTLYLNGRELLRTDTLIGAQGGGLLPPQDSIALLSVPVSFRCDGRPEVIALRLTTPPSGTVEATGLRVTLHAADNRYHMQRTMLHFGVFIGVNLIILVFALVIWMDDRRQRSWWLLAMLSLVSALDTVCELGGDQRSLGLSAVLMDVLDRLSVVLIAWPMYLLIMVLGVMRGDLSRTRSRWYTAGVLVMTGIGLVVEVLDATGVADLNDGLSFSGDVSIGMVVGLLFLGMVFGLILAWFGIEVIRLGFRLLRAKGYERWVGAGAVASLLLTLTLNIISQFTALGLSGWLSVIADYCSYVAVPVSVAIYLAIRSAHHNRLVARQRDDLDAEVKERTAELRAEKERSDELLLNILPHEVAEELKAKGSAEARHFDQATVLFTDFRGFTQLSEQVGPAELVQELNACFKEFDAIMGRYGIEKIKTIGDSYMAAGGLPDPVHGGPAEVVLAALDMQDFMKRHKAEREAQGKPFFEMRVGIHTGPVVAGIVGVKKFQYDIWGDTVNTASRMESSGEIGRVNLSGATHALVMDAPGLRFIPRGAVQAKGKGELEMWFVERA